MAFKNSTAKSKSGAKGGDLPKSAFRGPPEAQRALSGASQGPPESNRLKQDPPVGRPQT